MNEQKYLKPIPKQTFHILALEVAQNIDLKGCLEAFKKFYDVISKSPLIFRVKENTYLAIFQYGVIVFVNIPLGLRKKIVKNLEPYLRKISPFIQEDLGKKEIYEGLRIIIDPTQKLTVFFEKIFLPNFSFNYLKVISLLVAQSLALENYEKQLNNLLKDQEVIIQEIKIKGRIPLSSQALIKKIGLVMDIEQGVSSRLEIFDKPDLVWNDPQLDFLYEKLAMNLEIKDRGEIIDKKAQLVFNNTQTILNIIDTQKSHFLEIIIIFLIVLELLVFSIDVLYKLLK